MEKNSDWVVDRLAALKPDGALKPDVDRGFARLQERRDTESGRLQWWVPKQGRAFQWAWIAAGVGATCLTLMAFPITRTFAHECASECVVQSAKLREFFIGNPASSTPTKAFLKPADRKMAPDFTLNDASGNPVKLSDSRGQVVLLNFWATWCAPCKQEIPWFIELQQAYRHRGFTVLGVSLDGDGWKVVMPYVEAKKVNYPMMIANDDVTREYDGLIALPTTLIIDKSGRIAAIHVGLCTRQEYEADVNAVLNE